jgi:rhamnose utilization protein RhaD (predicted bifunctional aldolase and dehydrogenase)
MNAVQEIVALSRRYGAGYDWVIAGGGNTSIKSEDTMWVKASGTMLSTIEESEFVAMDRAALDRIWTAEYPQDRDQREARALQDLLDARLDTTKPLRPSVETLMHALFPHRLVVHTHPTLVNGITCAVDGEQTVRRLFGDDAVWVPTIDPGYTLARDMERRIGTWRAAHGDAWPEIVFMQNHGLVVVGETVEEIDSLHHRIIAAIEGELRRTPEIEPAERDTDRLRVLSETTARALADMYAAHGNALERPVVTAFTSPEIRRLSASPDAAAAVLGAFSPDHIVYMGHKPCYVDFPENDNSPLALQAEALHAVHDYCEAEDTAPKIVIFRGRGAVAVTSSEKKTEIARLLFLNAVQIAAYAESFGGSLFMPEDQIEFIRGWEVEKFREQTSTA